MNGGPMQALIVTETAGSWGSAQAISMPATATSSMTNAVSCASDNSCGIGGSYNDSSGGQNTFVDSLTL